jgi:hypothetical protein
VRIVISAFCGVSVWIDMIDFEKFDGTVSTA